MAASHAQAATEQERAGARAAANQGKAAFDAKHWADALDLFSRAEALVHSPVHLLYKARALVELGQFVKAQETYVDVTREQSATPSAALTKAQDDAKRELAALEPRLASVTVKVEGAGAADAAVTMDGVKLPAALVGLSSPADPGAHKFQAAGNGTQSDLVTYYNSATGQPLVSTIAMAVAGSTITVNFLNVNFDPGKFTFRLDLPASTNPPTALMSTIVCTADPTFLPVNSTPSLDYTATPTTLHIAYIEFNSVALYTKL